MESGIFDVPTTIKAMRVVGGKFATSSFVLIHTFGNIKSLPKGTEGVVMHKSATFELANPTDRRILWDASNNDDPLKYRFIST